MEMVQKVTKNQEKKEESKYDANTIGLLLEKLSIEDGKIERKTKEGMLVKVKNNEDLVEKEKTRKRAELLVCFAKLAIYLGFFSG